MYLCSQPQSIHIMLSKFANYTAWLGQVTFIDYRYVLCIVITTLQCKDCLNGSRYFVRYFRFYTCGILVYLCCCFSAVSDNDIVHVFQVFPVSWVCVLLNRVQCLVMFIDWKVTGHSGHLSLTILIKKGSPLSCDALQHYIYNSYSDVTLCVCTECQHSLYNDWYLVMFQFFYRSVAMRTSCSSNQQNGSNLIEHLKRLALYVLHSL